MWGSKQFHGAETSPDEGLLARRVALLAAKGGGLGVGYGTWVAAASPMDCPFIFFRPLPSSFSPIHFYLYPDREPLGVLVKSPLRSLDSFHLPSCRHNARSVHKCAFLLFAL